MTDSQKLFEQAILANDASEITRLLGEFPVLKSKIDEPVCFFDSPAIVVAAAQGSRGAIDALLEAGANINARSTWWAGSFGALDWASPEVSAYLLERGARLDVHSAARLGMLDKIEQFVASDPALVHARGGDGQTPLHFASTVEIAAYLLDHEANIDARDIDHESTPAQYMVRERQEIARYLIGRGCTTDILMAAAVGDINLVQKHLDSRPESIRMSVNDEWFPKQNPKSGGTIYNWTLGMNRSPHRVASRFGHQEVLKLLFDRSPTDVRLVNACLLGEASEAKALLDAHPQLFETLVADGLLISNAAEDNNTNAVRLMLELGWPVEGGNITPLHWAAWHGNAEMTRIILEHHPPLEAASKATFDSPPLGWAVHGSEHGWYSKTGDYGAVVEALLAAGAKPREEIGGSEAVRAALTAPRRPQA